MRAVLIISFLLLNAVFSAAGQGTLSSLSSHADFEEFAGPPLSAKFGEMQAVKIVYRIPNDQLTFLNSIHFKYHIDYCERFYSGEFDAFDFNLHNYSDTPNRDFLLADLNYIESRNEYSISLSPVDQMTPKQIQWLYNKVKNELQFDCELSFFLNTSRLEKLKFPDSIPTLAASSVYNDLEFQAISKSKRSGTLRIITDLKSQFDSIKPHDILLLNETPLYLPPVAGVVVTEFQTPLSHLSILGRNRSIPICASKSAMDNSELLALEGMKVHLEVSADGYRLEAFTGEADKTISTTRPKLKFNLVVDSLFSFDQKEKKSAKFIGNKAANFGALYKLSKMEDFRVPEVAFAIPFYYYFEHTSDGSINEKIQQLVNGETKLTGKDLRKALADIRDAIEAKTIEPELICDIESLVLNGGAYRRFRFRSSTNAEDIKGFSGAGLYDSKTGILYDEEKSFEKAIKKVWASLWNESAYLERELYQIDHRDAFMGVLVHRSFPNEAVNGVAITKNIYRPGAYGYLVNCQSGNENVVAPSEGNTVEQFICYPKSIGKAYEKGGLTELITYSNLSPDASLLSPDEQQNLADQLDLVKQHFFDKDLRVSIYRDYGLDVEFKIDGESRLLYFKQVRPF